MSALLWQFTDESGTERVVDTEQLCKELRDGRVAPTTVVAKAGSPDGAPAFTQPELSAAAIAASRRAKPQPAAPPRPSRAPSAPARLPLRAPLGSSQGALRREEATATAPAHVVSSTAPVAAAPPSPRAAPPARPPQKTLSGLEDLGPPNDRSEPSWKTEELDLAALEEDSPTHDEAPESAPGLEAPAAAQLAGDPFLAAASAATKSERPSAHPAPMHREVDALVPAPGSESLAMRQPTLLGLAHAKGAARRTADRPSKPVDLPSRRPTARGGIHPPPTTGSAPGLRDERSNDEEGRDGADLARAPESTTDPSTSNTLPSVGYEAEEATKLRPTSSAKPSVPPPPPERPRTHEMALDDHVRAAATDPAPRAIEDEDRTHTFAGRPWMGVHGAAAGVVGGGVPLPTATGLSVSLPSVAASTAEVPFELSDLVDPLPSAPPPRVDVLEVPRRSVWIATMLWVAGLVGFFFVGRVTNRGRAPASAAPPPVAASTVAIAPAASAPSSRAHTPRPCWVTRQPVRWSATAARGVPIDLHARPDATLDVGFAASEREAVFLRVAPKVPRPEEVRRETSADEIAKVASVDAAPGYFVAERSERPMIPVDGTAPWLLTLEPKRIGATLNRTTEPATLWELVGEEAITAEQLSQTTAGRLLTARRGTEILVGYIRDDRTPAAPLSYLRRVGEKLGKPRHATNGSQVAVVFASRPEDESAPWQLRLARAEVGAAPTHDEALPLPEGGPGGEAIAPDLIGLSDGRWLAMWTEGAAGQRAIRAQTYDAQFAPIGDPIALSPPAGSFGQATLAALGSAVVVAFLQANEETYELWGATLRCGDE